MGSSRARKLNDFIVVLDGQCSDSGMPSEEFYLRALVIETRSRNILLKDLVDLLGKIYETYLLRRKST